MIYLRRLMSRIRLALRNPWCRFGLHRWGLCDAGCHAYCGDCALMERTANIGHPVSQQDVMRDHHDLIVRSSLRRYVPEDLR